MEEEYIDIIYSRVSKEKETVQDLYIQEEKLKEKFNIKDPLIYRDRGSAYKIDKFKKRKEFIEFMKLVFDVEKTTILDIFLSKYEKKKVRLYVWDSHRLMRNMEFSLFFFLLSDFFGMQVFTYKDGNLKGDEQETPSKKLLRYMIMTIHSYSGEEYSYTTSENIKKSFVKKGSASYSVESIDKEGIKKGGLKVGRNFTRPDGSKVNMPYKELKKLNERIRNLHKYYQSKGYTTYYNQIIFKIKNEYGIIISKSYISRLK